MSHIDYKYTFDSVLGLEVLDIYKISTIIKWYLAQYYEQRSKGGKLEDNAAPHKNCSYKSFTSRIPEQPIRALWLCLDMNPFSNTLNESGHVYKSNILLQLKQIISPYMDDLEDY